MLKIKTVLSKKVLLSALVAALVVGGTLYAINRSESSKADSGEGTVNLNPATEEDAKRVEATKKRIVEKEEQEKSQSSQVPSGKQAVKPIITYADQKGVGAYVPVFEDGGTCTAMFTKGGASFNKTVSGVKNVNTVTCPEMATSSGDFSSKGTWTVVVNYDSAAYSGQSDSRTIEVK